MKDQEWKTLSDLLEKAIRGDEQAISEVCEFIDKHLKQETMNRRSSAGVVGPVDEGPISATLCEVPKTQATRATGDGET